MRVRLFRLGEEWDGDVLRLEDFPVTLVEGQGGQITSDGRSAGKPLCTFGERHGNLVLLDHEPSEEIRLNAAPVESGGLKPGDLIDVGERHFLVSYERTTSHPLPPPRYRIDAAYQSSST